MKTLPILILAALTATAAAQRKLWTWESPLKDDPGYSGNVNAAAVDSKGYSALLIGEWVSHENEPPSIRRHRVLWMSPKGKVLHDEVIDRPEEALHLILDGYDTWKVLHVSAKALAYTDGESVFTVKLRGKSKVTTASAMEGFAAAFAPAPATAFAGWFQQTGGPEYEYPSVGKVFPFRTPHAISLWSIK